MGKVEVLPGTGEVVGGNPFDQESTNSYPDGETCNAK